VYLGWTPLGVPQIETPVEPLKGPPITFFLKNLSVSVLPVCEKCINLHKQVGHTQTGIIVLLPVRDRGDQSTK
jgi:hypothetical protein